MINEKEKIVFMQTTERKQALAAFLIEHNIAFNIQQQQIIEKYINIPRCGGKTFLLKILRDFEHERGM